MAKQPVVKKRSRTKLLVVGIGASAGGLEAATALLQALPEKPNMSIVLVQHLDPTHESAMALLLSRATAMPVTEAKNNAPLQPNHVYVIPPNKLMVISRGRLKLSPRADSHEVNAPIDLFFKSLAREEGNRAIGVILSGSGGSDGSLGCQAIKSEGGITFAQNDKSAKYPGLPAAVVATGCVDFVLSPDKIARELLHLAGHPYTASDDGHEEPLRPVEEQAFDDILAILRGEMGVDFTHYKHATLNRRMQRRMMLSKVDSLKDYALRLRSNSVEIRELFNDILIHVTSFFRDPFIFESLKRKVFPRLLHDRKPEDTLRLWVPGCSTGEEVYSLAMALVEFLSDRTPRPAVQIFGTDINETALEKARAGIYPPTIQNEVSRERLRRFFAKGSGGNYRINKNVREMCIFARQNVVDDPPFSNLDLVSCRNLLIYLGPLLQRKVMPIFHYALRPGGYLQLGTSESIGIAADLFELVDKKAKIYAKKSTRTRPAVSFTRSPLGSSRLAAPLGPLAEPSTHITDIQKHADRIILAQHMPPGVVINRHMEVLQFRGRTGPFLEHPHGQATLDLMKMSREGLMPALQRVITRALKQNIRSQELHVLVKDGQSVMPVNIEVLPFQVPLAKEKFYLVLFEPAAPAVDGSTPSPPPGDKRKMGRVEHVRLKEELASTRESLQGIIEEQEATNEELRSANEEIMSSNEELQSTNEELETAKEELQSTNEELATLNDELENRNAELERVNNDLQNLLGSVNIPVVMVGSDLRIRRFNLVAEKVLNLIPTDLGRPLTDINSKMIVPDLGKLVAGVIDSLQTRDVEIRDMEGHWWSLRIRPYRTSDHRIDGAVMALVDIHLLKTTMAQIDAQKSFAEAIVNTAHEPLLVLDKNLVVRNANRSFYGTFNVTPEETIGHRLYELGNAQWNIPALRTVLEDILPRDSVFQDFRVEHTFPNIGRKMMVLNGRRLNLDQDTDGLILLAIEERSA